VIEVASILKRNDISRQHVLDQAFGAGDLSSNPSKSTTQKYPYINFSLRREKVVTPSSNEELRLSILTRIIIVDNLEELEKHLKPWHPLEILVKGQDSVYSIVFSCYCY